MARYITKESIEGLIKKLDLPKVDRYSQDWEYEIASSDLAIRLVYDYLNHKHLTEDEKFTLMHTIFESVNDYCSEGMGDFSDFDDLGKILSADYAIHHELLDEWACWDADHEDQMFYIAPYLRKIIAQINDI